jgi:hypothetical protein
MKKIKTYSQFKESLIIDLSFQGIEDLLESLTVWHDALLSAVGAEEVNIFDTSWCCNRSKESITT